MSDPEGEHEDRAGLEGRARFEVADFFAASAHVAPFTVAAQLWPLLPFAIAVFVLHSSGRPRDALLSLWPLCPALPLAVGAIWLLRRRWARQRAERFGPREVTFELGPQGLCVASSAGTVRCAWAALARAVATPRAFLVFTRSRQVFLLPKRAFSEPDLVRLTDLLRTLLTRQPATRRAERMLVGAALSCLLYLAALFWFNFR